MFGQDHKQADENAVNQAGATPTDTTVPATPSVPATTNDAAPAPVTSSFDTPVAEPTSPAPLSSVGAGHPSDELLHIKQEALQALTPLIGHLEQTPEEKFRTTMMMIQASDDQSLLKGAYDSAKAIGDEKVRAQALLDIVNEINYFTQQHHN